MQSVLSDEIILAFFRFWQIIELKKGNEMSGLAEQFWFGSLEPFGEPEGCIHVCVCDSSAVDQNIGVHFGD